MDKHTPRASEENWSSLTAIWNTKDSWGFEEISNAGIIKRSLHWEESLDAYCRSRASLLRAWTLSGLSCNKVHVNKMRSINKSLNNICQIDGRKQKLLNWKM